MLIRDGGLIALSQRLYRVHMSPPTNASMGPTALSLVGYFAGPSLAGQGRLVEDAWVAKPRTRMAVISRRLCLAGGTTVRGVVASAATPAVEKHHIPFTSTTCRVRMQHTGYASLSSDSIGSPEWNDKGLRWVEGSDGACANLPTGSLPGVDEVFHCQIQQLGSKQLHLRGCMHGPFGKAAADSTHVRISIVP